MIPTPLALLYCPTRRQGTAYNCSKSFKTGTGTGSVTSSTGNVGKSDYAANGGVSTSVDNIGPSSSPPPTSYAWPNVTNTGSGATNASSGICYVRSTIKVAHITDGPSNTYLFGKKFLNPDGAFAVSDDKGNGFKIFRNKLTMKIDGKEYEWEFTQDGKPFYIEWMFCHLNDHMIISQLTQVMIQRVKGGNANESGSTTSVSLSGPYRDEESRRASYGFQFISQKTGTDIKEFGVMFGMDAEKCAWSCQLIAEGVVREFRTDPARSTNAIFNDLNQSVGIPNGAGAYQQQAWWNAMYRYFFEIEDWYFWLDGTESDNLRDTKENYNLWRTKLKGALSQMLNSAAPEDKKLISEMLDLLENDNPSLEELRQIGQKFDSLHLRYGTKVPPGIRSQILGRP
jgi:hypothetical protein